MQRNVLLQIRLTPEEHAALKVAAADCGMSEFVRQAIAQWLTDPRTPDQIAQDEHAATLTPEVMR